MAAAPNVTIKLLQATFDKGVEAVGPSKPHVIIAVGQTIMQTVSAHDKAGSAVWNEAHVFPHTGEPAFLPFSPKTQCVESRSARRGCSLTTFCPALARKCFYPS